MDRSQLTIIATTAAITAVVTVLSKELVVWLLSVFRLLFASNTVKQKVRSIFSKGNLWVIFNLLFLVFCIVILILDLRSTAPVTPATVLFIFIDLAGIAFNGISILVTLAVRKAKITIDYRDDKKQT